MGWNFVKSPSLTNGDGSILGIEPNIGDLVVSIYVMSYNAATTFTATCNGNSMTEVVDHDTACCISVMKYIATESGTQSVSHQTDQGVRYRQHYVLYGSHYSDVFPTTSASTGDDVDTLGTTGSLSSDDSYLQYNIIGIRNTAVAPTSNDTEVSSDVAGFGSNMSAGLSTVTADDTGVAGTWDIDFTLVEWAALAIALEPNYNAKVVSKSGWTSENYEAVTNGGSNNGKLMFKYPDGDDGQGGGPALDFQLPSGYYVDQKLPIRILSPIADIGGDDSQYWRHATPDDDYVARVCVQGGSAPFRVTLDQAPTGMAVGETMAQSVDSATGMTLHEWDEDYMVISWPKASIPASGTHTVQFTVTGQDGMTSSVTYTVTCSASKFVWIDATATDDTGAGTYADPLKTFPVGLWKSSDADTTYAGKIAKFRAGTYSIYEAAVDSSPILNRTNKPFAYMAEVGAAVTFDTSRGHFRTTTDDGGHGLCVYGIDFNGSRTDLANNRIFNFQNISDNQIFWQCSFDNMTQGTVGNDNPAAIFHGNDTTLRQNTAIVDCEVRSGCAFQLWVGFSHDGVLVERAHANNFSPSAVNGSNLVNGKDTCSNLTIRYCYGIANLQGALVQVNNQGTGSSDQEVCFNRFYVNNPSGIANVVGVIDWNRQNEGTDMHDYRNSVVAPDQPAWDFNTSTEGVNFSLSLYYSPDGVLGSSYTAVAPNTVSLLQTDFDASGNLTGANRGAYLGQYGAEISEPAP